MKSRLLCIAVTVAALILTAGCVQVKEELVIQPDGSGTYTGEYLFGEQMTAMLGMAKSAGDMAAKGTAEGGAEGQPSVKTSSDLPMTAEDVRKKFQGPGIEIKDVKEEKKDGKQAISFNVAFKNVRELFKTEVFREKKPTLETNDRGELVFQMATEKMNMGANEPPPTPEMTEEAKAALQEQSKAMMAMMEPMLKDFKVEFSVVMPNEVTSGNAHTKEGRKATWVYDYAKLKEMGALEGKVKENVLTAVCGASGVTLPASSPGEKAPPGQPAANKEAVEVEADSQLQLGDNFLAAGMKEKALEAYKEVVEKYASTKAAAKARAKIAELSSGQ